MISLPRVPVQRRQISSPVFSLGLTRPPATPDTISQFSAEATELHSVRLWQRPSLSLHPGYHQQRWLLVVARLTSQQRASVSQGRICSDNWTSCYIETKAADQTFRLNLSRYTDTRRTSLRLSLLRQATNHFPGVFPLIQKAPSYARHNFTAQCRGHRITQCTSVAEALFVLTPWLSSAEVVVGRCSVNVPATC